jgi:hypothetical protein
MSASNGSFTTTSRKNQQGNGKNPQGNGKNQGFRGNTGTQTDILFKKFTIPLMKAHIFGKHYNRQDLLNKFQGVNSIYVNYKQKFAMKGMDSGMTGVTLTIRGDNMSQIEACFEEGKWRIQQSFESDALRKQENNSRRIEGIVSKIEDSVNVKPEVETMEVNILKKNGFEALGDEDSMKNYQDAQNAGHQKRLDKEVKRNLAEQMKIPPSTEWSNVVKTKNIKKIVRSTSLTNISTTHAVTAGDNWGDYADE